MKLLVALLVFLAAVSHAADEEEAAKAPLDSARILVGKFPLSHYGVESVELAVDYNIYNTGDKAAVKLTLDDRHSFPTQVFELVKGSLQVKFERLAAGANVTHTVIVRPRQSGSFNHTAAQVSYFPSEGARDIRVGYSNAPGDYYVYLKRDYDRRFAPKLPYWIVFFGILAPTTLFALYGYLQSKHKYEAEERTAKKSSTTTKRD